jgi:hypothetical protein
VPCNRALRKRAEEIVVRPVVAEPEHEMRRLLPVREEAPHVDPLVHAERTHLDDLMAGEHLGGCAGEVLVQVVQELASTPRAVLGSACR